MNELVELVGIALVVLCVEGATPPISGNPMKARFSKQPHASE
jgi:hypothetical protein